MSNQQIQEMLTILGWAMWIEYVKKHNVKNEGGLWPNYDFHEFYTGLTVKEAIVESTSEGWSNNQGSQSVVLKDLDSFDADRGQMELFPHDHVPGRRDTHADQLPLQEPGDGHTDIGPTPEPPSGV